MDEHEHYGPGQPMNAADVAAIIAERDRLRAVVEHDVLPWLRYVTDDARDLGDHERADATAALYRSIVEQLDRSADIGDHAEETCVDSACPLHGS
jgi:hypothetical protein